MATNPSGPSSPDDTSLAALLAAGGAGAAPGTGAAGLPASTSPAIGGYGVTGAAAGSGLKDTQGNQVVAVGSAKVSLDPRVRSADTVKRAGTSQTQAPQSTFQDDALRKSVSTKKVTTQNVKTVQDTTQEAAGWTDTQKKQFIKDAQDAGLITTKNPASAEVAQAWSLVVQEASLKGETPEDLLSKAKTGGWDSLDPTLNPSDAGLSGTGAVNSGNPKAGSSYTNTDNQATKTINYMDPATAQQALQQTYQRLMGADPTSKDYDAFLKTLYGYEQDSTAGNSAQRVTSQTLGPDGTTQGGTSNTQTTEVSQDTLGSAGASFIAEQQAKSDPGYGSYQAATTYFNALIKALSGPAAGMSASN